jgi:hypothetical protein
LARSSRRALVDQPRSRHRGRLEGLAVEVLTALDERDATVRDAERRAGAALWPMTDEEGLPVCEAVDPALQFNWRSTRAADGTARADAERGPLPNIKPGQEFTGYS